ncbi:MAG TPA: DUF4403 family protein [Chitinophagaceae bacterium]|nr:DUF4403 family protein [Chitinophagaceae bacterium]
MMKKYSGAVLIVCMAYAMILLTGCPSSRKTTVSAPVTVSNINDSLPPLPVSEIDIPIKIYIRPLLSKAETLVPKEFTSDKWPDYTQASCDFRYKYRFVRGGLTFGVANNQVAIGFGGDYQIAGSRSICAFDRPVSPWVSGSCGFGNEPMRKVSIALSSNVSFLPTYKVKTLTQLSQLTPIDRCHVTLFNNDMTTEVMDSIRASIAAFTHTFDSTVAALDFSNILKMVSEKSSRKIMLSKYGFLQVKPMSVRVSPMLLLKDTLMMTAGVSGYAELTSDTTELATINSFPALQTMAGRDGVSIYANTHYDYAFLSKIITDTIKDKAFDIEGRTFVIKNIDIRGSGNRQLEIRIDFAGSKKGRFILYGTPVLDVEKQTISIPDINYGIETRDIVLNVGEKLFRNRIINSLKEKAFLDLPSLITKTRPQLEAQLNRKMNARFSTRGRLHDVRITGLATGKNVLHLQTYIRANIQLVATGDW